jgi:hypothetical protein
MHISLCLCFGSSARMHDRNETGDEIAYPVEDNIDITSCIDNCRLAA